MPNKKKAISKGSNRSQRDSQGRFVKGWLGGPGNPNVKRMAEYRNAINAAIKPGDLKQVIRKLILLAKRGDMAAIKELLDRTVGKPKMTQKEPDSLGINFPALVTAADTVEATNEILRAVGNGEVSPGDAARMAAIVELGRRTLETHDLTQRLEALENELGEGDA